MNLTFDLLSDITVIWYFLVRQRHLDCVTYFTPSLNCLAKGLTPSSPVTQVNIPQNDIMPTSAPTQRKSRLCLCLFVVFRCI